MSQVATDPEPPLERQPSAARALGLARWGLRTGNRAILLVLHGLILTWMLQPRWFWIQGFAFVGALIGGGWLRAKLGSFRVITWASRCVLYGSVACLWRGFAYFADPRGSLVILGLPLVVVSLWRRRRTLLAVLLGYLAWVAWAVRFAPPHMLGGLTLLVAPLVLDVAWLRPSVMERVGPHLTSSFLMLLGTGAMGGALYYSPDRSDPIVLGSQPGVELLLGSRDSALTAATQVYSVVPDCADRHAIVTDRRTARGVFALDLATRELQPFLDVTQPLDAAVFACDEDRAWVGDAGTARWLELDPARFPWTSPRATVYGVPAGPGRIELAPERDLLWHLDSSRNTIRVHDLRNGALIAEDRPFSFGVLPLPGHRILAVDAGVLSERVLRTDAPGSRPTCDGCTAHLERTWELALDGDWRAFLSAVPNLASHDVVGDSRRAFVLSTQQGTLHAVDLVARRETARVSVPMGGRFLAYAPERDVVIGAGWVDGTVFFHRGSDLAHLRTVQVGKRPRIVSLTHDQRRVLVGSAAGLFAIDVPGAVADLR